MIYDIENTIFALIMVIRSSFVIYDSIFDTQYLNKSTCLALEPKTALFMQINKNIYIFL